jgi:choline-sulfatase
VIVHALVHPLRPLVVVLLGLIVGACGVRDCSSSHTPEEARASQPSLLLFTLDTTRRDRLGVYGSERGLTPVLDALAAKGVAFMAARTEVPITLPSHATILTGLKIREHGVRENGAFVVREDATTLPEILRGEGYRTAAFVSSFVLDRRFGLAQGIDHYDDEMTRVKRRNWHGVDVDRFERRGRETAAKAIGWLREHASDDRPFFLWVHFYDPHSPYQPPPEFRKSGRSKYDGEVASMDHQVGRVLRAARERTDDLLVVAASDHGEALGEHGHRGHGSDIYDPAMRAVLLFEHPRLAASGARPTARVGLAHVAATCLDVLGIDRPFAGHSLRPLWSGTGKAPPADDPLYMETILPALRSQRSGVHGLLTGHHKLILWPEDGRRELFDLAQDPAEENDLGRELPEVAERMERQLTELIPTLDAAAISDRVDMDEETVSKLRALGYIE